MSDGLDAAKDIFEVAMPWLIELARLGVSKQAVDAHLEELVNRARSFDQDEQDANTEAEGRTP